MQSLLIRSVPTASCHTVSGERCLPVVKMTFDNAGKQP
jgi:hypothetical protein